MQLTIDQNTREVAITAIQVGGGVIGGVIVALVGFWLGQRTEASRWRRESVRQERERWLDRRRELYASVAAEAMAVILASDIIAVGGPIKTDDFFSRLRGLFNATAEIRLLRGTRMADPAGDVGIAAGEYLTAASKFREGLDGPLRMFHPAKVDAGLRKNYEGALATFMSIAEADLRADP